MKAILIARVSTEEQFLTGNSLPAQMARLEKYCQNKGYEVFQVHSFDESAYTNERDEFDQILDGILKLTEKIVVCCDKVDRISRNIFDTRVSTLYEKALRDELELHFVSDGQIINSRISAAEKFHFSISLGLAKYYSDAISDNVKRANEQLLRKGVFPGKACIGLKNIRNADGVADIIIDESKAYIVREMFNLYATGAYSMKILKDKIYADFGIHWPTATIGNILNNQFYIGIMTVNGKKYKHRYSRLVSQTVFDQVQNVIKGFKKQPVKYAGKNYIYRGLLRCADCGLSITPEMHKGYVYYHCTQFNGKHGAQWLREEEITEQLGIVFKKLQMPEEVAEEITQTLNSVHKDKMEFHNQQFDECTKEQKSLTKMMDNLYMDKLKGKITDEQYDRFYKSLHQQSEDIKDRLVRLKEAEDNYYETAKSILDISRNAYEMFLSSEVEERRVLIKLVLSNLTIKGKTIEYIAHKPFDLMLECADRLIWLRGLDSNQRPLGYEPNELPDCSTPRYKFIFNKI